MSLPQETASPFARTEIPEPLRLTFNQPNGSEPVNLTGYTVHVEIVNPDGVTSEKVATIADAENGRVKYEFVEGDLDIAGTYKYQFRIQSGENPVTSKLFGPVIELAVFKTPKDEADE